MTPPCQTNGWTPAKPLTLDEPTTTPRSVMAAAELSKPIGNSVRRSMTSNVSPCSSRSWSAAVAHRGSVRP